MDLQTAIDAAVHGLKSVELRECPHCNGRGNLTEARDEFGPYVLCDICDGNGLLPRNNTDVEMGRLRWQQKNRRERKQ